MQKIVIQCLLSIAVVLVTSCAGTAQPDLSTLTNQQWQEDLRYMTDRVHKSFPGFTPEMRTKFDAESTQLTDKLVNLTVPGKILEMTKLLAMLQDGHTELSLGNRSTGFHRYPFILYYFGEELYVISTDEANKNLIGSTVLAFDGKPVKEVFEMLKPYINCDNDVEYITTAPDFMQLPEVLFALKISKSPVEVNLTVRKDGAESMHLIHAMSRAEFMDMKNVRAFDKAPLYLETADEANWYRILPAQNTLYINLRTLINQDGETPVKKFLKSAWEEFDRNHCTRLVIDLRLNRGGNYHYAEPLLDGIKKRPILSGSNKVIVVNGRLTFSAAAVMTMFLKDQAHALIVGEVSRSRPNWAENNESYYMPNSRLKFDCLDEIKIFSPSLGHAKVIPVDVEIKRTFENYKAGKDEVMEYIFSLPN